MPSFVEKTLNEIWSNTLKKISANELFETPVFDAYIKMTRLHDIDDEFATIVVPFNISKVLLNDKIELIQEYLSEQIGHSVSCHICSTKEIEMIQPTHIAKRRTDLVFEDKINKDYNFENFIVGKNNREAHVAALSCCRYPGEFNNPLFIFGNSGLGKTHLLHAIGNYIKENNPEKKVLYIYSEDFVTLLIEAMKNKTVEDVKERIASVDFLLIDDIQRLKQSTSQEIFFGLYNSLIAKRKQIVITSDMHPTELKGIENRLISRFSSGLSVSVGSPEFETAKAILLKKLEGRKEEMQIDDDVLDYLATRFNSDVRKLEGTLNELFFKAILYNPERIDLAFAKEIFKENPIVAAASSESLNVHRIKQCVCEYYGLKISNIESKTRTKNIANARHIAIYLCRKHLEIPFAKIGLEFGNRDHSTIMSSYEKMTKLLKEKEDFRQAVQQIEQTLGIS